MTAPAAPAPDALTDALPDALPDALGVVPARPDAPGVPFPPIADDAYDAELEAIAFERERVSARVLAAVRAFTVVAAVFLAFALRHDLRYAFAPTEPIHVSLDASSEQLRAAAHRLVELRAVPGGVGAVDYRRPAQAGVHRLAPLVDRGDVYVELRVPERVDPARFVPPTVLRGRLVPIDEAGVRFGDVRSLIERATGRSVPATAFVLEHGAEPSLRAPAAIVGLVAILVALVQGALLLRPRRRTGLG